MAVEHVIRGSRISGRGATGRKWRPTKSLSSMLVAVFAANGTKPCVRERSANYFARFPTDENVKRKWVLAMKRLDVNAAGIWEPKKGDVLCSRHFKKTDFDRSAPNIKLKPGVIPSIFDFPSHLQEHSYSVMDSPKKLKLKLDHVISELEDTKNSLQNVLDREKRFQKSLRKTIRELKDEHLISQETANRLETFCWECCQERIERDYIS
ncbi:THAP domain-containing protein 6 [Galemys pyrenaicus]|uniref:THAP domain-containing protein 6 n=1 Tax=Galemys pyrenaicus TaxID=202257 RepID=A0A8J6A955_GALPY|nr:THAP domain-containing protein 6 [Galemys pyrenaicus]